MTVDQCAAMRGLTLDIRVIGRRRMRVRIKAAVLLLKLASVALGSKANIEVDLRS